MAQVRAQCREPVREDVLDVRLLDEQVDWVLHVVPELGEHDRDQWPGGLAHLTAVVIKKNEGKVAEGMHTVYFESGILETKLH